MRSAIYNYGIGSIKLLLVAISLALFSFQSFSQTDEISCEVECPPDLELNCNDSTDPENTGYPIISCDIPCDGCTLTQGYWKTHSEHGPAPYDETWAELEDGADTEFFTTGESYYDILWSPPAGGNAYLILAHQWIAAQLNGIAGASMPDDVMDAFNSGQQLLEDYAAMAYIPAGPDKAMAIDLAGMLDDYNNGQTGPGHCDGDDDEGDCDEEIVVEWSYNDDLSGDCPKTITRTWTATVGDQDFSCTQSIVVSDNVNPVLVGVPDDVAGLCDGPIEPAVVTATDNCDDDVTVEVDESTSGEGCDYTVTYTYTATDDCGNTAQDSYSVSVIDNEDPEWVDFETFVMAECDNIGEYEPTATDNCSNVTITLISELPFSGGCLGSIERIYKAEDTCGNFITQSQIIQLEDNTPPELFGVPADTELDCNDDVPDAIVWATDNCDDDLVVTLTAETTPQDCGYLLVRTWTTVDDCDNEASESQTILVTDSEDPSVVSGVDPELTISCDEDEPTDAPVFDDNCDDELTLTSGSDIINEDGCEYDISKWWTAEDDCGNSSTVTQLIHVQDNEAPVLSEYPESMTLDCGTELPEPPAITASDNCDDDVQVTFEESIAEGEEAGCQLVSPESPFYDPDWAVWLQELPEEYQYYELVEGTWTDFDDGSAQVIATVASVVNPNGGFTVDVTFSPGMDWITWQDQPWPNSYKDDFGVAGLNYLDWIYYIMINEEASMTGWGDFEGSFLDLSHAPSSLYYAYQLGIAANNVNEQYGSGGWFTYEGVLMDSSTGYNEDVAAFGDLAFNHDCCDTPPVTWTWTAEDCAGNSVSHSATFTFAGEGAIAPEVNPTDGSVACPGDFNENGAVDSSDLLFILADLGCDTECHADMDGDDKTTVMDILLFLNEFGTACE
jgi:hypothetical protein